MTVAVVHRRSSESLEPLKIVRRMYKRFDPELPRRILHQARQLGVAPNSIAPRVHAFPHHEKSVRLLVRSCDATFEWNDRVRGIVAAFDVPVVRRVNQHPLALDKHFDEDVSDVPNLLSREKLPRPRDARSVNHHDGIAEFARDGRVDQAPIVTATQAALGQQLIGRDRANRLAACRPCGELALDPKIDFAEMRDALFFSTQRINDLRIRQARLLALREIFFGVAVINAERGLVALARSQRRRARGCHGWSWR